MFPALLIARSLTFPLPREILRTKCDTFEEESRQAKEHLAEMARTATDYSNMIQKKEEQISRLSDLLESSKSGRENAIQEIQELQGDIDTLVAELEAEKDGRNQQSASRIKLQEELDELRTLMEAKTSEETRRAEVERSKEAELAILRDHVDKLQQDLADTRHSSLELQKKLRLDLDHSTREHTSLQQSHKSLLEK